MHYIYLRECINTHGCLRAVFYGHRGKYRSKRQGDSCFLFFLGMGEDSIEAYFGDVSLLQILHLVLVARVVLRDLYIRHCELRSD